MAGENKKLGPLSGTWSEEQGSIRNIGKDFVIKIFMFERVLLLRMDGRQVYDCGLRIKEIK